MEHSGIRSSRAVESFEADTGHESTRDKNGSDPIAASTTYCTWDLYINTFKIQTYIHIYIYACVCVIHACTYSRATGTLSLLCCSKHGGTLPKRPQMSGIPLPFAYIHVLPGSCISIASLSTIDQPICMCLYISPYMYDM